jgi:hypothetical protein
MKTTVILSFLCTLLFTNSVNARQHHPKNINLVNGTSTPSTCTNFNAKPEERFLHMLAKNTTKLKIGLRKGESGFEPDSVEDLLRDNLDCLNERNHRQIQRVGKKLILDFYLKEVEEKKDYAIELLVNPPYHFEKELVRKINKLKTFRSKTKYDVRWVLMINSSPSPDFCTSLIKFATGKKVKKASCPGNNVWAGSREIGTQAIKHNPELGKRYTVWTLMTPRPGQVLYTLVCIEKSGGACTRLNVPIAETNDQTYIDMKTYAGKTTGKPF